jgi:hypothetical protein
MQVSCGNCQLSFDAPDGATGLVCPICRGPLLAKTADGAAPASAAQEWSGGDLDDLIAILSAPAVSARVEVLGANGDASVGEVHLLAGGVSDALIGGKSTDDALDKLRAGNPKRFRVEQRLPNPTDGDLTFPGPETGTLESRALAHLMRYCEDYVISCSIEVWRGNENARVDYKRGEINGVTVGGIDAPERLAEVMQWASGNYRLVVPPFKLPAVAPKRPQAPAATPAPVPAPAPSAQAARQGSATKTIFGMPAADVIKARAAAETARAAAAPPAAAKAPSQPSVIVSPQASAAPPPAAAPAPAKTTPPGVAPSATPAPVAGPRPSSSATKTIFGVPSPAAPGGYVPVQQPTAQPTPSPVAEAAPAAPVTDTPSGSGEPGRKTGARKVDVPAPDVSPAPPAAAPPQAAARAADMAATQQGFSPPPAAEAPAKRPSAATSVAAPAKTAVTPEPAEKKRREAPVWTYVWVGVAFGLAFLGIIQLVGLLSH